MRAVQMLDAVDRSAPRSGLGRDRSDRLGSVAGWCHGHVPTGRAEGSRAGPACAGQSRQPPRGDLLDGARGRRLAPPARGPGGVVLAGRQPPRPARRRPGGHRAARRRTPRRDAALALPGAPLGGQPARGLHPVRLAHPGAPDRADLADPDRRLPARPDGAAVRAHQRHGHHRLRGRAAAHQGAGRRHGTTARARAHHRDRRRRGRRDVSLAPQLEWRRLSARMLLIHPVREVGRFIPAIAGLLIAGRTTGFGPWWGLVGVVLVIALSIARWYTTRYRITPTQVELRTGLLNRKTVVVPADRVRTVDVTAPVLHRLLGLAKVDIGTGGGGRGESLVLDALSRGPAGQLRAELLHRRTATAPAAVPSAAPAASGPVGPSAEAPSAEAPAADGPVPDRPGTPAVTGDAVAVSGPD